MTQPTEWPDGDYPGVVAEHHWEGGDDDADDLRLSVTAELTHPNGDIKRFRGTVWCTMNGKDNRPGTLVSPGNHDDGTPKRCKAMLDLNALGYRGAVNDAGEIGRSISLVGNAFRATLRNKERNGFPTTVIYFNPGRPKKVDLLFKSLGGQFPIVKADIASPNGNSPSPAERRPEDGPPPPKEEEVPF
jgi:hypothetical protein